MSDKDNGEKDRLDKDDEEEEYPQMQPQREEGRNWSKIIYA